MSPLWAYLQVNNICEIILNCIVFFPQYSLQTFRSYNLHLQAWVSSPWIKNSAHVLICSQSSPCIIMIEEKDKSNFQSVIKFSGLSFLLPLRNFLPAISHFLNWIPEGSFERGYPLFLSPTFWFYNGIIMYYSLFYFIF